MLACSMLGGRSAATSRQRSGPGGFGIEWCDEGTALEQWVYLVTHSILAHCVVSWYVMHRDM